MTFVKSQRMLLSFSKELWVLDLEKVHHKVELLGLKEEGASQLKGLRVKHGVAESPLFFLALDPKTRSNSLSRSLVADVVNSNHVELDSLRGISKLVAMGITKGYPGIHLESAQLIRLWLGLNYFGLVYHSICKFS